MMERKIYSFLSFFLSFINSLFLMVQGQLRISKAQNTIVQIFLGKGLNLIDIKFGQKYGNTYLPANCNLKK